MSSWEQDRCSVISASMILQLFWTKPHREGPSQSGPTAHRRAQSSLSLRKGKGGFLKLDAAVMRSLFIRLFFRASTDCVNYRARGCTLSSLRSHASSWEKAARPILTTHQKPAHKHKREYAQDAHTNARTRQNQRNQSASCCSGTFLSCLLQTDTNRDFTPFGNVSCVFKGIYPVWLERMWSAIPVARPHWNFSRLKLNSGEGSAGAEACVSDTVDDVRLSLDSLWDRNTMAVDGR